MYRLHYVKSNGDEFYFDVAHRIMMDLEPLSELDVNISTSQGFEQVGVTVENTMVEGVDRTITGHIIGYANEIKEQMLRVFSPFSTGKLYFNDRYYCDCEVKTTPAIGSAKRDVGFMITLYCAYPFWLTDEETVVDSTVYTPCFSFPDPTSGENEEFHGYDQHIFAIKNESTFFIIDNLSEIDVRFDVTFYTTTGVCTNYGLINVRTLEKLTINDTLNMYEKTRVYWDGAVLKVEKTDTEGNVSDIFYLLDDDSDLFWLYQGENVLQTFADSTYYPDVSIEYNTAYVGVYDGKGESD